MRSLLATSSGLLILFFLVSIASPIDAESIIPLFDGQQAIITPSASLTYFQFRMQSFKSKSATNDADDANVDASIKKPDQPIIPPIILSLTNLTKGSSPSDPLAMTTGIYASISGFPSSPSAAMWSSTNGILSIPSDEFVGDSYLSFFIDLGDAFVAGQGITYSISLTLFNPLFVNNCVPQRWIVGGGGGLNGAGTQFQLYTGGKDITFSTESLSGGGNSSFTLYVTSSDAGVPSPSNYRWFAAAGSSISLSQSSGPAWPSNGWFNLAVDGQNIGEQFMLMPTATSCSNTTMPATTDEMQERREKEEESGIAWA